LLCLNFVKLLNAPDILFIGDLMSATVKSWLFGIAAVLSAAGTYFGMLPAPWSYIGWILVGCFALGVVADVMGWI